MTYRTLLSHATLAFALVVAIPSNVGMAQAPSSVVSKTPPPGKPVRAAAAPGAYTRPDGTVVLPDGTRLVQATDGPDGSAPNGASGDKAPDEFGAQLSTSTSAGGMTLGGPGFAPGGLGSSYHNAANQATQADNEQAVQEYAASLKQDRLAVESQKQRVQTDAAAEEAAANEQGALNAAVQMGGDPSNPVAQALAAKLGVTNAAPRDVDPSGALRRQGVNALTARQVAAKNGLALIPASTIITMRSYTRVNTQLGGTVIAFLDHDVLDNTFRHVVLPKGSKVLGRIILVTDEGTTRATLIFKQVVLPNGDQVPLFVEEPATDAHGAAGVEGTLNRRLVLKFGTAIAWGLVSGVTAPKNQATAAGLSGGGMAGGLSLPTSVGDIVKQNVSNQFSQIGQQQTQAVMQIKPQIVVKENEQMRILLTGPIYAKPWKAIRPF